MSAPLSDKDANATMMDAQTQAPSDDVSAKDANAKSMEYHRKILADKIAQQSADEQSQYVSPSDGLMSPCTAKLSALRSKKMDKAIKPKSLFQKASARNLSTSLFDSKTVAKPLSKSASKPVSSLAVSAVTPPSPAPKRTEPVAETEMEAKPETEAKTDVDTEMETETEAKPEAKAKTEVDTEMETETTS